MPGPHSVAPVWGKECANGRWKKCRGALRQFGNIVPGVYTPVLAKHSRSFSLVDLSRLALIERRGTSSRHEGSQWLVCLGNGLAVQKPTLGKPTGRVGGHRDPCRRPKSLGPKPNGRAAGAHVKWEDSNLLLKAQPTAPNRRARAPSALCLLDYHCFSWS